ncbi:MAG: transposase, partial [Candidatus Nitrosocosmicus sp.]
MKYISIDCFIRGLFCKDPTEEICKYVLKRRERVLQKGIQEILSQIPEGFTIAVQDESIFVHDVIIRRKLWLPKGIRPVVTSTGSHQRTCVFGTLTREGKQLFRQYDMFNQDTFLDYLKQIKKRLGK